MAATVMRSEPKTDRVVWPAERLALAERLWAEGHKARDVAEQCGVTRNALLGMAHRKRWPRGEAVVEAKPPERPAEVKPRLVKPRPERVVPRKARGRVRLLDIDDKSCRWPVEGAGAAILFCGKPVDLAPPGSSYCWAHRVMSSGHGGRP